MKNYLSDMAWVRGEKEVEKNFLKVVLKNYGASLPKTLKEMYIHLDLDVPTSIKVNSTPKRSPKKTQEQSPSMKLSLSIIIFMSFAIAQM